MKRLALRAALILAALVTAVLIYNAPLWAPTPADPQIALIAHRGVHQTFSRQGLDNDTCTATRIGPPEHQFIENTIASMRAAFEAGADIVELDVHPTTDGQFAVMHDWTLDCRTEGAGETRSHDMAYLKTLDLGYGYTADGGETFPFRGKFAGQMPELKEIFATFPNGRFLINYKSNEVREGDMLAALLTGHPEWRPLAWGAYGGDPPTFRAREMIGGDFAAWSASGLKDCLLQYFALGWTGYVPDACRNTKVMLPINLAPLAWGWPNLLVQRLGAVGSEVIVLGPYGVGDVGTSGIDTLEQLEQLPEGFSGYIWTNRIEVIGPAMQERRERRLYQDAFAGFYGAP